MPFSEEIAGHYDGIYQLLSRKYRLEKLELEIAGEPYRVYAVDNLEEILDELAARPNDDPDVRDERLPYWAEVWPSALALAGHIAENNAVSENQTVLEIGCGLGIPGMVAAKYTEMVLMTDYMEDALFFTQLNCMTNLGRVPHCKLMDWRQLEDLEPFDIILASDVVYEKRYFWPLIELFKTLLRPDGKILLAEPNRSVAQEFFEVLEGEAFNWQKESREVFFREKKTGVSIYTISKKVNNS
ncbi:MAG: methyltransferase domain-containing protein [Calditrichia bacterium]